MEALLEEYLVYLKEVKKTSENTLSAYRNDIHKLIEYLEQQNLLEYRLVTFTNLNAYILLLERSGAASSTVSRTVSVIKSFFSYLFRMRVIDGEPTMNLHGPKLIKKVPDILTVEEMDLLLAVPDTATPKGQRDKAMLELLYATGIKVTELISLPMQNLDLSSRYITCIDETGRGRIVPFGATACQALQTYLEEGRPLMVSPTEKLLFVNVTGGKMSRQGFWKIIKHYGEIAGFGDRLTPHIFRHSFAAHMIHNGADLKSLQEMLGHSDISTTQIYGAFSKSGIYSVYEKSHPRK